MQNVLSSAELEKTEFVRTLVEVVEAIMHHKVILGAYDNWLRPIPLNTFYVGTPKLFLPIKLSKAFCTLLDFPLRASIRVKDLSLSNK